MQDVEEQAPVAGIKLDDRDTPELGLASSLIPWEFDDERAQYFGYRCCGFSTRETLQLVHRTKSWLANCRHLYPGKERFCEIEASLPELRQKLAREHIELDFFRNFRLVMEKDFRVIKRSLGMETVDGEEVKMSPYDHSYLLKMRSHYTPQAMAILESVVKDTSDGFNFSKWVAENQEIVQMSRTDTVTFKKSSIDEDP